MSAILIVGATSSIAEHCARIWARQGNKLFLVGRNTEKLSRMAVDLEIRGATKVGYFAMDLNDVDAHLSMLSAAEANLADIDIVLIAHGTLSDQSKCQSDVDLTMREINNNALSVIAILTPIANMFESKHRGTIAVISSVAGDRGRQSNYIYGSAKAMVTAFAAGLRQRLHKSGVSVVTIKPGLIDTPMTMHLAKGPLWRKPEQVAIRIVSAIGKKRDVVYVPGFWWLIMAVIKIVPEIFFKKLKL